jgi:hypothetical protein
MPVLGAELADCLVAFGQFAQRSSLVSARAQRGSHLEEQSVPFLDVPRAAFGMRVRIAERDKDGRLVGTPDAHV